MNTTAFQGKKTYKDENLTTYKCLYNIVMCFQTFDQMVLDKISIYIGMIYALFIAGGRYSRCKGDSEG